jgi:HAD superfamily hydrolase (TIGR01549 family)
VNALRAVLFDVDFTLCRPGPELSPESYVSFGERFGLSLDPARFPAARDEAIGDVQRHPELAHDEELWIGMTERIVLGMGGAGAAARACAEAITLAWEQAENFELYPDALPTLATLRKAGLRIGLITNAGRDLARFVSHHSLDVDVALASREHGKTKPDPSIFLAALESLDARPDQAAMVGDSWEDDVLGARALGMRAFLIDREGRYPGREEGLPDLSGLPGLLGLDVS